MGTPASPSLDVNLNPDILPAISPSRGEVGEVVGPQMSWLSQMTSQASSSGSWESALDILAEKNGHAPGTPVRKPTPFKDADVHALLRQGEVRASRKALSFSRREAMLGTVRVRLRVRGQGLGLGLGLTA